MIIKYVLLFFKNNGEWQLYVNGICAGCTEYSYFSNFFCPKMMSAKPRVAFPQKKQSINLPICSLQTHEPPLLFYHPSSIHVISCFDNAFQHISPDLSSFAGFCKCIQRHLAFFLFLYQRVSYHISPNLPLPGID